MDKHADCAYQISPSMYVFRYRLLYQYIMHTVNRKS